MITERKNDLTYREMEILNFIVEGKSNPEISEALSISLNTVKAHCKSIFEKLNVDSRVDAAVKAILSGLVWL